MLKTLLNPETRTRLKERVVWPGRYMLDDTVLRMGASAGDQRPCRMLLLSDGEAYCSEQQFYAFDRYRRQLRETRGVITRQFRIDPAALALPRFIADFDVVGLKLSYRTPAATAQIVAQQVRAAMDRNAKLVYFDGDDDVCIMWPEVLATVDLYIKKHTFSELTDYHREYSGKSNIHDYVHRTHHYKFKPSDYGREDQPPLMIDGVGPIEPTMTAKIRTGWNIALDKHIFDLRERLARLAPDDRKKTDITYRGHVKSETFTYYLRNPVTEILASLEDRYVITGGSKRVTPDVYYEELTDSKICVSPFGFGEVCWRDFEAVLCKSLLIKPDMGHITTNPDIFVPYETYVPVKWDFSDLVEKIETYLADETARRKIVDQAHARLEDVFKQDRFLEYFDRTLGAACATAAPERTAAGD